ncbi:MAG: hypothetical protein K6C68_00610 [Ruminococcus sp.]|nr:hypothetical protein [Ruminococcus sp.]
MMRFLFCSKRGIRRVLFFAAAALLIVTAYALYDGIQLYIAIHDHPENFIGFDIKRNGGIDLFYLEAASLTAFIPAVWFLCDSAFSFGTANGASRRSVIGSLIVGLPLAAVLVTLVSELLCLALFHGTFFFNDWHLFHATPFSYPKWADTGFDYFLLYAAVFLLLALFIAASVGFVYAAYRKFGVFGVLCGALLILTVYAVLSLMFYADTNIAKTIRPLFLHEYKEYHVFDDGERYCEEFTEARPASFFALVGGYAAVCITAMWLLLRRSSIRPAELGI